MQKFIRKDLPIEVVVVVEEKGGGREREKRRRRKGWEKFKAIFVNEKKNLIFLF